MRMAAACLVQSRIDSLVHYSLSDLENNNAFLQAFFFELYLRLIVKQYLSTCIHSPKILVFLLRQY